MAKISNKRERLLRAANHLIRRQGFRQTTLADIAKESGIPPGNVYYYFKTKRHIGQTIVADRVATFAQHLDSLDGLDDPKARLLAFLDYPLSKRTDLSRHGCPLGALAYELSHIPDMRSESARLVEVVLTWTDKQFLAMGCTDPGELAFQFVTNLQGMRLIATPQGSPQVIDRMVARSREWIESL